MAIKMEASNRSQHEKSERTGKIKQQTDLATLHKEEKML